MACDFEIIFPAGQPPQGPAFADEALELIADLEQKLSVYIPHSEISEANQNASATPVAVSQETFSLIEMALNISAETERAFDCTAAELTNAWGFSRREGRVPTREEIESAVHRCDCRQIELNADNRTVYFKRNGIQINTGAIGKGYAIDRAHQHMSLMGCDRFLLNGGHSSAKAKGNQPDLHDGEGWRVAVRHPSQTKRILGEIRLINQALGTSGPANQFFYFGGKRYGHIIDPRTGYPVDGWLSTTVLTESAASADALATALYVMGPDAAIDYCQRHPEVSLLGFLPTKREGDVEAIAVNLTDQQWLPAR